MVKKVLFTATTIRHIKAFHLPYLKLFKDNGYEVHVATRDTDNIPYCDVKHTVPIERSPYKINNIKAIIKLKTIIDKEKFDIIHCHTPMGSVVTRIAAIHARKKGTRVIYTAHGFHFYKGAPIKNWLFFYPVEKTLSKYTDTLITINNEDYELAKKKFTKTQVEYVQGVGIDINKFNFEIVEEEKLKLREQAGLEKGDFVIIYTAELNKNKNQAMIIKTMKKLVKEHTNIHLLLVGKGNLKGYYETKVKEYNLQNNIHFLGYRNDVPRLLKISDLAISTSKREGLPVNIIEALVSGLPCVVTNCRGNRDLLCNNNGYIVEINDVENLVNKIFYYYNKRMVKHDFYACNSRIDDYSIDNVIEKVRIIYRLGDK